ncbi:hypothetical protein Dsin_021372 [Dipteronia sinensis]|uniref:Tyrosine-specific transport protein n=1 Tax=Dipteronia sinensis TaxID=43782 RepID=A0AAE0A0G0_9ROSI|nr:hypothetical protein Dsin_021372 [Dipteronia sinensis]
MRKLRFKPRSTSKQLKPHSIPLELLAPVAIQAAFCALRSRPRPIPKESPDSADVQSHTNPISRRTPPPNKPTFFTNDSSKTKNPPFISITKCTNDETTISLPIVSHDFNDGTSSDKPITHEKPQETQQEGTKEEKSFWGAVSLIIGTAVGPGMLGLPAATIRSGSLSSTISILLSWVYVISSIILVAELTFAAMEADRVEEVSFTGLATKALGSQFGAFVALVYASLSFALLVACVSGIGSIVSQLFPWMNLVLAHIVFPLPAGIVILFFPFKAIDVANLWLCFLMFVSITALVTSGLSIARRNLLGSFSHASWSLSSILPAIPVTVLTLGFHVITPLICKIAGNSVSEARKAILIGGAVPLIMVLSWNLIVLGLAGTTKAASSSDPISLLLSVNPSALSAAISLLLSVNPSALSAVQCFAFAALATSFIGYAVSLPKQLVDTLKLIFGKASLEEHNRSESKMVSSRNGTGRVGFLTYSTELNFGNIGKVSFYGSPKCIVASETKVTSSMAGMIFEICVTILVLSLPVLIASFFPSIFSRALDFAGVYANCFLFGILPPAMAYIQQSRKKLRYC